MKQTKPPKPPRIPGPPFKERLARWKQAFKAFLRRVMPQKHDDEKTLLFKKLAWAFVGMMFLVVFLSTSVFFLALRGEEDTMIPQVIGKDLTSAILDLQEKELMPVVQVKFSTDPREKGNVIAQDPQGGLVSKAGRRVTLWVSKGAIVDSVENFVGQNINDVRLRLKALFAAAAQPLITLPENPVYVFSSAPEGTILEQKPQAGTPLASPIELQTVISKGPKGQTVKALNYVGLPWAEAIGQLVAENQPFLITVTKASGSEQPGQITAQSPVAGSESPKGTPMALTLTEPLPTSDGRAFHLLETKLPEYPILVDLKVELRKAVGDQVTLLQMKHPGGLLTLPYLAAAGDIVSVSVLDKEVYIKKTE